ncbi:low-density lipoprotein receptor-related protein 6-like isoform X2 [Saccostrea cucullata]|uniref:low-density lipoprotein receptor-related protein 6-like isoform X2 n=1 Tax=Saccostrea cuccullata TaxID=36930 RepID=UPI002ED417B2
MDTRWGTLGGVVLLLTELCTAQNTGLVVSDLPSSSWYNGGMTTFEGYINQFSKNQKPQEHTMAFRFYDFEIMSMEWDGNNTLYFMEGLSKAIFKLEYFNIWMNHSLFGWVYEVHGGISYTISSRIAFDHVSRNMYWTDALYNWIAVQPVDANDNSVYKVLISEQLSTPGAIAVDPNNGYLFWSNNEATAFIERSDLSGKNRQIIVRNLLWVPDMKCDPDPTQRTLYWADNYRNTLESSDYNGGNRKVIYRSRNINLFITNIVVYRNVICATEYDDELVFCVGIETNQETWRNEFTWEVPWGLTALTDKTTTSTNPCQNEGCEHICTNSASGAVCHCKEGYTLNPDNKSCNASHSAHGKAIIFSSQNLLCSLDARIITYLTPNVSCFLTWDKTITHIAVAANDSKVIFAAGDEIVLYDLVTNQNMSLASTGNVSGLVYSWIGDDIFWSESDTGKIKVMSLNSDTKTDYTIFTRLSSPRDLAIDPHNNKLYWISFDANSMLQIESGNLIGGQRATKQTHLYSNPSGLFYDVKLNILFWISNKRLTYLSENNKFHTPTAHLLGPDTMLLIYNDYSISTKGNNSFRVYNLYHEDDVNYPIVRGIQEITAISIMDPTLQPKEENKCDVSNGGCEQICVPSGSDAVCECGFGFVLQGDKHNCTTRALVDNFAVAVDFNHGMIYQISLNDNPPLKAVSALDIPQPADPLAAVYYNNSVFWSDYMDDQILKTKLNSNITEIVYSPANYIVYSLAVDHSTGNIYYTGYPYTWTIAYSRIGVVHYKSHRHKTILNRIDKAYSLALHPAKGYVFWIDGEGSVGRANMDGTDPLLLVAYGMIAPNSITIDYTDNKVYYIDNDRINSMNVDGTNRKTLHVNSLAGFAHLAISGDYVYATATHKQEIIKINKASSVVMVGWMTPVAEFGRLETISVYRQTDVRSVHPKCSVNNGLCSTFCFPLPNSRRSCGCPDGVTLLDDQRTCSGVQICKMAILHGRFTSTCSGYVNSSCDYECNTGYEKALSGKLTCNEHLNWMQQKSVDPNTLCIPSGTKLPPGIKPAAQTQDAGAGVSSGTFAAVIIVIILIFIVIIVGIVYFMYRRRNANMFSHAKFVNSPNVPDISVNNDAPVDDRYTSIGDIHQPTTGPGQAGMENPLYKVRNETPDKDNATNTMSEQGFKSVDMTTYKY